MAAAEARAVLRRLLRSIDTHLTSVAENTQWRDYVLTQFRQGVAAANPVVAQRGVQLAKDYTQLIENIAHHRDLLRSYNIGLDPDERNKKMVEATARRVGFALPTEEKPPPRRKAADASSADVAQQTQHAQQHEGQGPAAVGAQEGLEGAQQPAAEGGGSSGSGGDMIGQQRASSGL